MELGQLGMARIGRERGGHPVHADVVAVEVLEHAAQVLERPTQVRAGLPSARVVGGQAALAQDLDGKAEPHVAPLGRTAVESNLNASGAREPPVARRWPRA